MDYIINTRTLALITEFDQYGNENTLVYELTDTFIINKRPIEIVEASFNYLGNGLEGAMKGARQILNKKKLVPVALHVPLGIILFPCKLAKREGIAWLINKCIYTAEAIADKITRVYLINGARVEVAMSFPVFQDKRNQSSFLYTTLNGRYDLNNWPSPFLNEDVKKIAEKKAEYIVLKKDED